MEVIRNSELQTITPDGFTFGQINSWPKHTLFYASKSQVISNISLSKSRVFLALSSANFDWDH